MTTNKFQNTKNLCIIPARGGSKRIPRKNIKDFLGKPIIAYSIEVAKNSGLFDEVMVSTDDKEIADIAKQYGAKMPFFRSRKNANDYATLAEVIDEVKKEYLALNKKFDNVCCILPTAPLITVENNTKALNLYKKLGFEIEGVYKKHGFYMGVYCNTVRMALFNPNFDKNGQ